MFYRRKHVFQFVWYPMFVEKCLYCPPPTPSSFPHTFPVLFNTCWIIFDFPISILALQSHTLNTIDRMVDTITFARTRKSFFVSTISIDVERQTRLVSRHDSVVIFGFDVKNDLFYCQNHGFRSVLILKRPLFPVYLRTRTRVEVTLKCK